MLQLAGLHWGHRVWCSRPSSPFSPSHLDVHPNFRQKVCTWLPKCGTFLSVPSSHQEKGLASSVNE